ncbi:MFS transporter [Saccharopolyspora sp. NPDC002376]
MLLVGGRLTLLADPLDLARQLVPVDDRLEPEQRQLQFGGIGFPLSCLVGPDHFWWAFALLIVAGGAMYAPYGPYFAHVSEILPRNFAGAGVGCVNTAGSIGGFFGTYLVGWLNDTTGSTAASFVMMDSSMVVAALIPPLIGIGARSEKEQREAVA